MRDLVELIADASWICDAPRRRPAASPGEAGLIESSGILSKTLQKVLVNGTDPEQAVAEASTDLRNVIEKQ